MPIKLTQLKAYKKDTVSSFASLPLPKKSIPENNPDDLSLSSSGGNPHVLTCKIIFEWTKKNFQVCHHTITLTAEA